MSNGSRSTLMSMSRRDADDLYASLRDANRYIAKQRDPGTTARRSAKRVGLDALEVGAGALGVGWLAGRMGTTNIGSTGIPLGLTVAAAGHALAYFGVLGSYSDDLQNVSNGALAAWLAMWGAGQGTNARAKAGEAAAPIAVGRLDAVGGRSPLSEAELQSMADRYRRVA